MTVVNVYMDMIEGKAVKKPPIQSAKEPPQITGQEREEMKIMEELAMEQTADQVRNSNSNTQREAIQIEDKPVS